MFKTVLKSFWVAMIALHYIRKMWGRIKVDSSRIRVFRLMTYAAFAALALFTLPTPLYGAAPGLDSSWVLGLHLAADKGMIFGRDIVFTYGPLGYLSFPLLVDRYLWLTSLTFIIAIQTTFYLSLASFALRSENRILSVITAGIVAPIVTSYLPGFYIVTFFVLVVTYLLVSSRNHHRYLPILAIFVALTFYMKTEIGLLSFLTFLCTVIWIVMKEKSWKPVFSLVAYVAAFVVSGILFTRSVSTFQSYLWGSEQIALGYQNAMAINAVSPWVLVFPPVSAVILLILALLHGRPKSTNNKNLLFVLGLPFLLITFKIGFVRADLHVLTFFFGWAFFCLLILCVIRRGENRLVRPVSSLLLLVLLIPPILVATGFNLSGKSPPQTVISASDKVLGFLDGIYHPSRFSNLLRTIDLILNQQKAEMLFNSSVSNLKKSYPLSQKTLAIIQGHSVDIIPWDISLAYAYGLQWDPAPIFQSYSAYTPYLDQLNAKHYEGQDSPDFVLYSNRSIDGRYPAFDEPLAFHALITDYHLVTTDGPYLLLAKRSNRIPGNSTLISIQDASFGQSIEVPSSTKGLVVGRVFVEPSLLGKVVSILYKIPEVTVDLGESKNYKYITSTGPDGLSLKGRIAETMFQLPSVDTIAFHTDGPQYYYSKIRIEFYEESFDLNNTD